MSESVRAANTAFDELVSTGKAVEEGRTTFHFGFAAGIRYAQYLLDKRIGRPIPRQLVSSEARQLEYKS